MKDSLNDLVNSLAEALGGGGICKVLQVLWNLSTLLNHRLRP